MEFLEILDPFADGREQMALWLLKAADAPVNLELRNFIGHKTMETDTWYRIHSV